MRNMLKRYMKEWDKIPEQGTTDYDIQIWVTKFDDLAIQSEAKWGVGRLDKLVSKELWIKWQAQMTKIENAINNSDVILLSDLYEGTKRGYEALENEVMQKGFKPHDIGSYWTHPLPDGGTMAICATNEDASIIQAHNRGEGRFIIITLEEVANMVEANQLVNVLKHKTEPEKNIELEPFNFKTGDVCV